MDKILAKIAYEKLSWQIKEEIIQKKLAAMKKKVVPLEDLKYFNVNIKDDLSYLN